jgi:hypothetical protein
VRAPPPPRAAESARLTLDMEEFCYLLHELDASDASIEIIGGSAAGFALGEDTDEMRISRMVRLRLFSVRVKRAAARRLLVTSCLCYSGGGS